MLSVAVNSLLSQDTDTTGANDSGRESYTSVDLSFMRDRGNTEFLSLYYGFNYVLIGDMGPLKDTEFLFDFNRSDDQLDGEPFIDDQSLTLIYGQNATKLKIPLESIKDFVPIQLGDVEVTEANTSKIYDWIGFRPKTNLKVGLSAFVKWYKNYYKSI